MENKILVAYATKHGSTTEIAEKIGQVLRQAGMTTDVLPTDRIRDLTAYKAVILGSAVYLGKWLKKGVDFLQTNEQALAERAVWLFSSGPTGEGDRAAFMKGTNLPESLHPIADRIQPRSCIVFHGSLNMNKLNLIEKWMIKNTQTPLGDFRDWDAITSWAASIADVLKEPVS